MADIPYVIASHGCSKRASETSFFNVPENITIVYFNNHGVLSNGNKNIPFLKSLYKYQIDLLSYIVDPTTYKINLDKTNTSSYRHPDFFKSFPVYSSFNYFCNLEIYTPGSKCPRILLTFNQNPISIYFQGLIELQNIEYNKFGKRLEFEEQNRYDPYNDIPNQNNGQINIDDFFKMINSNIGINKGIFFISACRADTYFKNNNYEIIDINIKDRNCGDISYDNQVLQTLYNNNNNNENVQNSLNTTYTRFQFYNDKKNQYENSLLDYPDVGFYNNDIAERLYQILFTDDYSEIFVNFKIIKFNNINFYQRLEDNVNDKFLKIRTYMTEGYFRENSFISENFDESYYYKFKYVLHSLTSFISTKGRNPTYDEYYTILDYIWSLDNLYYNRERFEAGVQILNPYFEQYFNFTTRNKYLLNYKSESTTNNLPTESDKHRNYKSLYIKYKKKYLELKNKIQNGGMSLLGDNRIKLTIYTTGISNWLNAREDISNNQNLARIYSEFKDNLISQIPTRFTVHIKHYDPLVGNIDTSNNNNNFFNNLCQNINYIKNISDNEPNNIISNSEFIAKNFTLQDVSTDEPYFILDFAHVFTYTADPNVVEYGRNYFNPIQPQLLNFNVIRFGFLGDPIPKAIFSSNGLFIVNDDNSILTLSKKMKQYLNFLSEPKYWQNPNEPSDIFSELIRDGIAMDGLLPRVNSIKIRLENKLSNLLGLSLNVIIPRVDRLLNDNNFMRNITNKLINSIWNETMPRELNADGRLEMDRFLDQITTELIEENFDLISV